MIKPQAVLFDLDGTLLDTVDDLLAALNKMLIQRQRPIVNAELARPWGSDGAMGMLRLGFPELTDQQRNDLRAEFLSSYDQCLALSTQLYAGVSEMIGWLESHAIQWAIVTNKPSVQTAALLPKFDLFTNVSQVVCGDTLASRKPDPAPLLYAANLLQREPEHCWYIGDAERDIIAGNAAGMTTAFAGWGYIPPDQDPDQWGADHLCSTPQDLLQILQSKHNI